MSTPFDANFGTKQGRITPSNWIAPEGSYAFVLGNDQPGVFRWFAIGDRIEISQSFTPTAGTKYVRARLRIRGPAAMPLGTQWTLTARIDGAVKWTHEIAPGHLRDLADFSFLVANLAVTDHLFAFRLELTGTGVDPLYDLELPAVYVDALVLDATATRPALANRDPEPNEIAIPVDSNVAVEITDVGTDGISVAATKVYVDGALAYDGGAGGFQTGFTGPGSIASNPDAKTLRVVVGPLLPLANTTTIPVHVVSATSTTALPLDVTYSFSTEDLASPALVSVTAVAQKKIRVVFSEPITLTGAAGVGDGLNPSNYAISRTPAAGTWEASVTLVIVSAVALSDHEVELTTDIEQTPAASYTMTVTAVEDIAGNAILAPTNALPFAGWAPDVPEGRLFDLLSMLPRKNVNEDDTEDLAKLIACFQEVTNLQLADVDRFTDILDPDTADILYVERMLRDLGNPFPFPLTDIEKRLLVPLLVPIYRQKGTDPGIINAIRFFMGIEITITVPNLTCTALGLGSLGGTFCLGSSNLADIYTMVLNSPIVLTDEQRTQMLAIAVYMRRSPVHIRISEPTPPPAVVNHLSLGLSQLGLNWRLH
jgi:phage tail-like protein